MHERLTCACVDALSMDASAACDACIVDARVVSGCVAFTFAVPADAWSHVCMNVQQSMNGVRVRYVELIMNYSTLLYAAFHSNRNVTW